MGVLSVRRMKEKKKGARRAAALLASAASAAFGSSNGNNRAVRGEDRELEKSEKWGEGGIDRRETYLFFRASSFFGGSAGSLRFRG